MPYPLTRASAIPPRGSRPLGATWRFTALLATASCASPSYGGNPIEGGTPSGAEAASAEAASPVRDAGPASAAQAPALDPESPEVREGASAAGSDAGPGRDPEGNVEGSANTAMPDAGAPTILTLPLWARPLLGKYAVQAFSVKQDEYATVTVVAQILSVEFVQQNGGLQLHATACRLVADNGAAVMTLVDPSVISDAVSDVTLSETDQRWSTSPPMFAFGFTEAPPELCKGKQGQNVPHLPAQVWLSSTCRCPLPNEDPKSDDCRVLDPDKDRRPGATYTLRGKASTIADVNLFAAGVSNSFYTDGQVAADGKSLTANVVPAEKAYQLGCDPTGCADLTDLGTYCVASKNHAQFVRLDPSTAPAGGFTCADLVSRAATLFSNMPPPFSTTCP